MYCPKCNTTGADNMKFCGKCGAKLIEQQVSPTIPINAIPNKASIPWWAWLVIIAGVPFYIVAANNQMKDPYDNSRSSPEAVVTPPAEKINPPKPLPSPVPTPICDISKVARQSPATATRLLGPVSDSENGKWRWYGTDTRVPYTKNYYQNGKIEVLFIQGKASRININLSNTELYTGSDMGKNLKYIGISSPLIADASGNDTASYSGVNGLYEVSVHKWLNEDGGGIIVITDEKYK